MTPREPDRFEAKARTLCDSMSQLPADLLRGYLAAALRAVEAEALERAALECERWSDDTKTSAIAARIRALAPSPEASPAKAEPLDATLQRMHGIKRHPAQTSEPIAPAPSCTCKWRLEQSIRHAPECPIITTTLPKETP